MRVSDFMTPDPITLPPDATLAEAFEIMLRNEIHELPVIDGSGIVGIITERDLRALLGPGTKLGEVGAVDPGRLDERVEEYMTREVMGVTMDDGLGDAARALADLRVGALPVVDGDGRLVGILSITDVLAAAAPFFEEDE